MASARERTPSFSNRLFVEPLQLLGTAAGHEARREQLPEHRIVLPPAVPRQLYDGLVDAQRRGIVAVAPARGVAAVEDQVRDVLGMANRIGGRRPR